MRYSSFPSAVFVVFVTMCILLSYSNLNSLLFRYSSFPIFLFNHWPQYFEVVREADTLSADRVVEKPLSAQELHWFGAQPLRREHNALIQSYLSSAEKAK